MGILRSHPRLVLVLAMLGLLLPFVGKAFHIDDPIFLWTAEQIQRDPSDFFGFDVNWYGVVEPMYEVNKNPPLVSYYIAFVAWLGGWTERVLHLGMWVPALALVLGLFELAGRLCRRPLVAGLVAVTTPVFLVSATSLMSDVSMLALWIWSLLLFMRALESHRLGLFVAAGVLMGACVLTKYFGMALIPLLLVYGGLREKRPGAWLLAPGIAALIVAGFALYSRHLYGFDPLFDVMDYAISTDIQARSPHLQRAAIGVFFLGGCMLGTLLWAPLIWEPTAIGVGIPVLGTATAVLLWAIDAAGFGLGIALHQALFGLAGLHLLALALVDVWRNRDPDSLLLTLWVFGVFVFAAFTNWTTNGRSILPAVPAFGILVARALDRRPPRTPWLWVPNVVVSALLALVIANADAQLADSGRLAARDLSLEVTGAKSRLYFQGSWGFQRYMELAGVERLAIGDTRLEAGDRVVMSGNSSNVYRLPEARSRLVAVKEYPNSSWISIMSARRAAGFYASVWGPLPYVFGATVPERYAVYRMTRDWAPERRGQAAAQRTPKREQPVPGSAASPEAER